MENKLYGKTIIWNGDSICSASSAGRGWSEMISEKNNMTTKNFAVSGGTIADGFPLRQNGNLRHSVLRTIDAMYKEYPDADYIVLEGGSNDADLIERGEANLTLGSFDVENFSGKYDLTTFCGAFETLIYKTLNYWCGKKICFIVAQKMGTTPQQRRKRRLYFDKAVEICKKWGIPYLDLWEGCYLNPDLMCMYNKDKTPDENKEENKGFYVDGQHLTLYGYEFTADIIDSWLKTI